jgi:cysteine desulfurase
MGIAGMAAALEVAVESLEQNQLHIGRLKRLLIELLREGIPGVRFNGLSGQEGSIFNVLNVSLPPTPDSEMILANLDIRGIAASGGSACSSGSDIGSHVLRAIQSDPGRPSVRFSFSKYNTEEEIRQTAEVLCSLFPSGQPVS